jgi:hypothetical protein
VSTESKAARVYNLAYPRYQQLYRSLKSDFAAIAKLVDG